MRLLAHERLRNMNVPSRYTVRLNPKPRIDWFGLSWVAVGMSFVVALTLYAVSA